MRLTHFQVYGEPVVIRSASSIGSFYSVRCGCGARLPDGDGWFDSMYQATEAGQAHERVLAFAHAFDNGARGEVEDIVACSELLRLRDERVRDVVIRSIEAAHEDVRVAIAEWCETALVRELWRHGDLPLEPQSIADLQHILGVLVATALDSPRQW